MTLAGADDAGENDARMSIRNGFIAVCLSVLFAPSMAHAQLAAAGANHTIVVAAAHLSRIFGEAVHVTTIGGDVQFDFIERRLTPYVAGSAGIAWGDYRCPFEGTQRNWGASWDAGGGVLFRASLRLAVGADLRDICARHPVPGQFPSLWCSRSVVHQLTSRS